MKNYLCHLALASCFFSSFSPKDMEERANSYLGKKILIYYNKMIPTKNEASQKKTNSQEKVAYQCIQEKIDETMSPMGQNRNKKNPLDPKVIWHGFCQKHYEKAYFPEEVYKHLEKSFKISIDFFINENIPPYRKYQNCMVQEVRHSSFHDILSFSKISYFFTNFEKIPCCYFEHPLSSKILKSYPKKKKEKFFPVSYFFVKFDLLKNFNIEYEDKDLEPMYKDISKKKRDLLLKKIKTMETCLHSDPLKHMYYEKKLEDTKRALKILENGSSDFIFYEIQVLKSLFLKFFTIFVEDGLDFLESQNIDLPFDLSCKSESFAVGCSALFSKFSFFFLNSKENDFPTISKENITLSNRAKNRNIEFLTNYLRPEDVEGYKKITQDLQEDLFHRVFQRFSHQEFAILRSFLMHQDFTYGFFIFKNILLKLLNREKDNFSFKQPEANTHKGLFALLSHIVFFRLYEIFLPQTLPLDFLNLDQYYTIFLNFFFKAKIFQINNPTIAVNNHPIQNVLINIPTHNPLLYPFIHPDILSFNINLNRFMKNPMDFFQKKIKVSLEKKLFLGHQVDEIFIFPLCKRNLIISFDIRNFLKKKIGAAIIEVYKFLGETVDKPENIFQIFEENAEGLPVKRKHIHKIFQQLEFSYRSTEKYSSGRNYSYRTNGSYELLSPEKKKEFTKFFGFKVCNNDLCAPEHVACEESFLFNLEEQHFMLLQDEMKNFVLEEKKEENVYKPFPYFIQIKSFIKEKNYFDEYTYLNRFFFFHNKFKTKKNTTKSILKPYIHLNPSFNYLFNFRERPPSEVSSVSFFAMKQLIHKRKAIMNTAVDLLKDLIFYYTLKNKNNISLSFQDFFRKKTPGENIFSLYAESRHTLFQDIFCFFQQKKMFHDFVYIKNAKLNDFLRSLYKYIFYFIDFCALDKDCYDFPLKSLAYENMQRDFHKRILPLIAKLHHLVDSHKKDSVYIVPEGFFNKTMFMEELEEKKREIRQEAARKRDLEKFAEFNLRSLKRLKSSEK